MKKISLLLAIILTMALLLSGCGSNSAAVDAEYAPAASSAPNYAYDSGSITESYDKESSYDNTESIYNSESNKIIRTATLTIQAVDFDATIEALNRLTSEHGGYYETAEVQSGGYYNKYANRSAYYVVRVPKENFASFRDGSGSIGHVYSISENSQNVGETYYDTEARLATLTTKRERLLALLEKAEVMEDIITLENALAEVQYEIDMHTATLRKYDSLIDYATFYIRINEVEEIVETPGVKETFGSKFVSNLKRGFVEFGEWLQDVAIWIAYNLVGLVIFAAVVVVIVVVVRLFIRRRRERKNRPAES